MLSKFQKISDYLRRLASRRPVRKTAATTRLDLEVLEDRTVLTATGSVTGSFINAHVVGAAVTLQSISGPATPVTLTSFTDANSSFTFSGLPAGNYEIITAPFADVAMVGTLSDGTVTTSAGGTLVSSSFALAGGQTFVENITLNGGYAPASANMDSFVTSFSVPSGPGTPNNTPVVATPISNQILSAATPSTVIDLAGNFTDAAITNSQVTFNITNGTTPETMTLDLFDTQAPQTVANFLDYVNSGEYNNDVFSRIVTEGVASSAISVLQGGGVALANPAATDPGLKLTEASPQTIQNEASSANLNTAGTIAMAESSTANSASDQFFFNTIDNPSLDAPGTNNPQAFTVFGQLADTSSMTALTALAATPTQNEGAAAGVTSLTGVDFGTIPLTGYTNAIPTNLFPTDATASNFMVINSVVITKQNDFLTYAVTSSSPLVSASFLPNHPEQLKLSQGTGSGTATITVTATDRFGATTTTSFTVTVANQAPSGASNTVTTAESTPYVFQTSDFGFTDSNTPANTLNAVEITTLPTAGTLTDNGNAVTAATFVPVADISGDKLVFTPTASTTGSPFATFTFQVQSNGSTANGGVVTDPTAKTMTINVVVPNQAPSGTSKTLTIADNSAYAFSTSDFGFTDPNTPASTLKAVEITTTPTAGTLTDDASGSPVTVTAGTFVPAADITAGDLVYTPTANSIGSPFDSFTFQVQNNGGTAAGGVDADPTPKTMTVDVVPNQAPSGTPNTITIAENGTHTFSTSDFGFSDPNTPAFALKAVEITAAPTAGTLTDSATGSPVTVTDGTFVPVADITGGNLVFTPASSATGSPYNTFTFQVQNNGGTANGGVDTDPTPRAMTINVIVPNHAPSGTNNSVSVAAGNSYTFLPSDFGFSDTNDTPPNNPKAVVITTTPTNGNLADNGVLLGTAGTPVAWTDITNGLLVYTPSGTANDSFTFQVQDDGGTLAGGVDTDPSPKTMLISVT